MHAIMTYIVYTTHIIKYFFELQIKEKRLRIRIQQLFFVVGKLVLEYPDAIAAIYVV